MTNLEQYDNPLVTTEKIDGKVYRAVFRKVHPRQSSLSRPAPPPGGSAVGEFYLIEDLSGAVIGTFTGEDGKEGWEYLKQQARHAANQVSRAVDSPP